MSSPLEKIRKANRIADDPNAETAERQTARRVAKRMMAAHDITAADLAAAEARDRLDKDVADGPAGFVFDGEGSIHSAVDSVLQKVFDGAEKAIKSETDKMFSRWFDKHRGQR